MSITEILGPKLERRLEALALTKHLLQPSRETVDSLSKNAEVNLSIPFSQVLSSSGIDMMGFPGVAVAILSTVNGIRLSMLASWRCRLLELIYNCRRPIQDVWCG